MQPYTRDTRTFHTHESKRRKKKRKNRLCSRKTSRLARFKSKFKWILNMPSVVNRLYLVFLPLPGRFKGYTELVILVHTGLYRSIAEQKKDRRNISFDLGEFIRLYILRSSETTRILNKQQ